ncbi:MAG: hypothetical protein U5L95_01360 [Candidatus Saccharibacteria bacterium]|nr:hypothetical protein [Candidatus Saccharibacteria bacterium]
MSNGKDPMVTKSMLEENNKVLLGEIGGILDTFMTQADERFNRLEVRMDRLNEKLEKLTARGGVPNDQPITYQLSSITYGRRPKWLIRLR